MPYMIILSAIALYIYAYIYILGTVFVIVKGLEGLVLGVKDIHIHIHVDLVR